MATRIKKEPDLTDGDRYQFVAGLGKVPTGPRGDRFGGSQDRSRASSSYDSYRPQYRSSSPARYRDDRRKSLRQATLEDRQDGNERSATSSRDNDSAPSDFRNQTSYLSQLFAEAQRNRSDRLTTEDSFNVYRDSRRSDSHLPGRQIKQEIEDELNMQYDSDRSGRLHVRQNPDGENPLFVRDSRTPSPSSEPSGYGAGSSTGDTNRSDSSDTTPPPPPPIARPKIPGECKCPVTKECPARADHLIDCRTLVIEWEKWTIRQAEGEVEVIAPDVDPEDEEFATLEEASRIVQLCNNVTEQPANSNPIKDTFIGMKAWINTMSTKSLTEDVLVQSTALTTVQAVLSDANDGVRQDKRVPINIIEDLKYLARKWETGDLSQLPRRGLMRRGDRGRYWPDPNWEHRMDAKFFGHGHLVNGQKWNTRAAMARDGAHAPLIAGISGNRAEGAYSVVMGYHDTYKHDFYADIDCGNRIWYLSTALHKPDAEPSNYEDSPDQRGYVDPELCTNGAKALMKSVKTGQAVRVFRSFRASKICPHRPEKGFRYDGLYEVVDYELLKADRQIYRFEMVRLDQGQGPIRSGVPAEPITGMGAVVLRGRRARMRREREARERAGEGTGGRRR